MSTHALEEIDRILDLGDDADNVLRAVVARLVGLPTIAWAGVLFLEGGSLVLGPEAGVADPSHRHGVPVLYRGAVVGELAVDGETEESFLDPRGSADLDPRAARLGYRWRSLGTVGAPPYGRPGDRTAERRDPSPLFTHVGTRPGDAIPRSRGVDPLSRTRPPRGTAAAANSASRGRRRTPRRGDAAPRAATAGR